VAEGSFTTRIVRIFENEENQRSENKPVKNNEAKELTSKMHQGIRAE